VTALSLRHNTDVPSLSIQIDGTELPGTVPITSVEIISAVNRIPIARLRLADGDVAARDFPNSSGDFFVPGGELSVIAGYRDQVEPVFTGIILRQRITVRKKYTCLEVECRNPAIKMTLNRHHRYFEEQSDSEIAETLIGEYDLSPEIEATEVVHPQLFQYHASDWDFMVSRLEANGQIIAVEAGTVKSFKPALDGEAVADIVFGDTLVELDAEFDARAQSPSITAFTWDPAEQALAEAAATDPNWISNNNLSADELSGATERSDETLVHGGSLASDALQSWSDSALLRSRLAGSRGRARFRGIPSLHLGDVMQLSAISDRFNGKILITGLRHEFSNNIWMTDIEFGLPRASHAELFAIDHLPSAGLQPSVNGLQIGVVTQLADDPAGENRIRVKIPIAGMDEQGVWARLATLDAGAERGTFFRPEVDDEVVLGFFHDDPAHPVILGMLHSSAKAPPIEPTEDNHEKAYVSREKLKLHFDDDKKIITLETPGGNKVLLDDDTGGITLEDQNGNKIEMNSDGIALTSAKEIVIAAQTDFGVEGVNVEIKASAELKAEGGASAEVKSSGTMTVKGSLVQIN
jgi:Rhs element Vgr protein